MLAGTQIVRSVRSDQVRTVRGLHIPTVAFLFSVYSPITHLRRKKTMACNPSIAVHLSGECPTTPPANRRAITLPARFSGNADCGMRQVSNLGKNARGARAWASRAVGAVRKR